MSVVCNGIWPAVYISIKFTVAQRKLRGKINFFNCFLGNSYSFSVGHVQSYNKRSWCFTVLFHALVSWAFFFARIVARNHARNSCALSACSEYWRFFGRCSGGRTVTNSMYCTDLLMESIFVFYSNEGQMVKICPSNIPSIHCVSPVLHASSRECYVVWNLGNSASRNGGISFLLLCWSHSSLVIWHRGVDPIDSTNCGGVVQELKQEQIRYPSSSFFVPVFRRLYVHVNGNSGNSENILLISVWSKKNRLKHVLRDEQVVCDPVTIRRCGMNVSQGFYGALAKWLYCLFQIESIIYIVNYFTHSEFRTTRCSSCRPRDIPANAGLCWTNTSRYIRLNSDIPLTIEFFLV